MANNLVVKGSTFLKKNLKRKLIQYKLVLVAGFGTETIYDHALNLTTKLSFHDPKGPKIPEVGVVWW